MLLVDGYYRNLNLSVCEIWDSHRSVAEDSVLLGCNTSSVDEWFLTFRRVTNPSSSGSSTLFLDQLTLQMKDLQSFRMLGTSHPTTVPNNKLTLHELTIVCIKSCLPLYKMFAIVQLAPSKPQPRHLLSLVCVALHCLHLPLLWQPFSSH